MKNQQIERRNFLTIIGLGLLGLVISKSVDAATPVVKPDAPMRYYLGTAVNPPDLKCWAVARGFPRKRRGLSFDRRSIFSSLFKK